VTAYGKSDDKSGIYGTIACIFIFQGIYSFCMTPLTSLYTQEISNFKTRATAAALCRIIADSTGLIFSFAMPYAMQDLGWKFYMINGAWDAVYVAIIYLVFVETKGLELEEISVLIDGMPAAVGEDSKMMEGRSSLGKRASDEKMPVGVEEIMSN
jgi:hypothetical protein